MNREDIIRMAREAWISEKEAEMISEFGGYISCTYLEDLERFAALVAAAEREACAQAAAEAEPRDGFVLTHGDIVRAIRARGNT